MNQGLLNFIEMENDQKVRFDFYETQLTDIEKAKHKVMNRLTKSNQEANKEIEESLEK